MKKSISSVVGKSIWGFGSFVLFFLNLYISLYPEKVREYAGDKFVDWALDLPRITIGIVLGFTFIAFLIYEFWAGGWFNKEEKSNGKSKSVWDNIDKPEKNKKYKASIDVHKSPYWEKDGKILLCVHNESFFKKLWDLSVIVTGILKIENGSSNLELGRSVILNESFHLGNRRSFIDLPFIEISKDENEFFIFAKHQEDENGKAVQYKFQPGEYVVNVVLKKLVLLEKPKVSPVIPIRIKYDGFDRIEWKIDFLAVIDYKHGKLPSSNVVLLQ